MNDIIDPTWPGDHVFTLYHTSMGCSAIVQHVTDDRNLVWYLLVSDEIDELNLSMSRTNLTNVYSALRAEESHVTIE